MATKKSAKKALTSNTGRVEALLEDMSGKFDFVVEHVSQHSTQLTQIHKTLSSHTGQLETIQQDIEFIKHELKQKVNRDEFAHLEKRVLNLEKQLRLKQV